MKKSSSRYYALFFVLLSLSCSKDDDQGVQQDPVIGSWQAVQQGTIPVLGTDLVYYDAPYTITSELIFELGGTYSHSLITSSTDEWLQNAIESNPDDLPDYDYSGNWSNTRDTIDFSARLQSYRIARDGSQGGVLAVEFNASFTEFEIIEEQEDETAEREIYVKQ